MKVDVHSRCLESFNLAMLNLLAGLTESLQLSAVLNCVFFAATRLTVTCEVANLGLPMISP